MTTTDPDATLAPKRHRVLRVASCLVMTAALLVGCSDDDAPGTGTGGEGITESDDGAGGSKSTGTTVAGNDDDGESDGLNSDPNGSEGDPGGAEDDQNDG